MPTFSELWNNHPNIKGDVPLLDKKQYENQCAVNLYAALQRSGINIDTFHGQLSWQKGKPRYAIRAQELANWLASPIRPLRPSTIERHPGSDVFEKIKHRLGVIFFQNYWGAGNQGDHIDLWNGSRLTDWFTWVRIHARIGSFGVHSISPMSDFKKSQSVWFWTLP